VSHDWKQRALEAEDEAQTLRAKLRVTSDFLADVLTNGLPGKGRSQDDRDAILGWWDERWLAVRNAREALGLDPYTAALDAAKKENGK
jgi:hypothetical protein